MEYFGPGPMFKHFKCSVASDGFAMRYLLAV